MADQGEVTVTLTPRRFVRLKHPTAFCETNGPDFQVVVLGKYATATVLGLGRNRRRAWSDAAKRLYAEKHRRMAIRKLCKWNKIDQCTSLRWIEDGVPLAEIASEILYIMEERGRENPRSASKLGLTKKATA